MHPTLKKLFRDESITQAEHDALIAELIPLSVEVPADAPWVVAPPAWSRPIKIEG